MPFAKRVFLVSGIYGLIVLVPMYFLEDRVGRDSPPPITHPEFFYGFVGTALAFQVVFLIVARDPRRYRTLMIPSVLEKLTFGIAAVVLFARDRLSGATLGFGIVDLVLGALFVVSYFASAE